MVTPFNHVVVFPVPAVKFPPFISKFPANVPAEDDTEAPVPNSKFCILTAEIVFDEPVILIFPDPECVPVPEILPPTDNI